MPTINVVFEHSAIYINLLTTFCLKHRYLSLIVQLDKYKHTKRVLWYLKYFDFFRNVCQNHIIITPPDPYIHTLLSQPQRKTEQGKNQWFLLQGELFTGEEQPEDL